MLHHNRSDGSIITVTCPTTNRRGAIVRPRKSGSFVNEKHGNVFYKYNKFLRIDDIFH
jgi:hypothetical protein